MNSSAGSVVGCFLEAAGAGFVRVYSPQRRSSRRLYAKEVAFWAAVGAAAYKLMMLAADSPMVPDDAIVALSRMLPWLIQFWTTALLSIAARRCHDLGLSGGWALFTQVPIAGAVVIAAGFLLPSRLEGRIWPRADGAVDPAPRLR